VYDAALADTQGDGVTVRDVKAIEKATFLEKLIANLTVPELGLEILSLEYVWPLTV
jgi:hypothetical protein